MLLNFRLVSFPSYPWWLYALPSSLQCHHFFAGSPRLQILNISRDLHTYFPWMDKWMNRYIHTSVSTVEYTIFTCHPLSRHSSKVTIVILNHSIALTYCVDMFQSLSTVNCNYRLTWIKLVYIGIRCILTGLLFYSWIQWLAATC